MTLNRCPPVDRVKNISLETWPTYHLSMFFLSLRFEAARHSLHRDSSTFRNVLQSRGGVKKKNDDALVKPVTRLIGR